jgi:DNA-binding response OmpR family regulator
LVIDLRKKSVTLNDQPLALTRIEYQILILLAKQPGTVFSIEEIFESVWHEKPNSSNNNTIMVHIRKLREKIERQPRTPRHIKTVWGIGYKFDL